ncbi:14957_t:CDS:2, partial [Gigaspora rosea]
MPSKLSQWMQQAIDGHHVEFIPYDSFTDHKEIARGAYGEVTKAYWPTAEKAVALKSLFDNPESESDKDFDAFIKEFQLIRSVHYHDNVIRVFGISQVKNGEREKPVDGTPNDYRMLYEWAWCQNPKDRPDINTVRAGLEKIQQNNNKRLSHNNMPQPYQYNPNPSLNLNENNNRSNSHPNLLQNYTPQIYQPMIPYTNNNNHVIGKPLPQPLHNPNMNQGMTPVQQQLPNNASNVNYPPGINNFQQPIYPTVNAGQSQPYHNTNQTLIPNNFNKNQQQFNPIAYAPPNMNAQSMANVPTINAPIQAYQQSVPNSAFPVNQQYPGGNVNQQALGANFNQPVPGNNQKVPGNNYNQQALGGQPNPGSNFAQYPGGNANQQVIGNNANQVPVNQQASINYQIDNKQYQQGVQQPGLPNKISVGHQPAGCKQILEKYEKYFNNYNLNKPTECKAGYHAGFGDIEGLKYHLSSCGESITGTYEFGKTNDLLCVIVARYCDNIEMVEDIFKLLRFPSDQLNDPSKQPNLSWNSVKHKKTVLHYLSQNNNLISGIDIISKDKKKPDDVSENKKKMETFHNHITRVIEFLVNDGCDINAKDDNERTVLELYLNKTTFQAGFTKVIEVLLKNGANPNIKITVRTKNLNRKSSSKINVLHTTSNGSASNLGVAEGCITLPNMLFLAIWNRWPKRVLDLLKEHGVDINTKYDNLGDLGNLLKMCLEKSKNGKGNQLPYIEGLEWVLNNVPNVCGKENLEAAKKLTDKNSEERKLIKHKIGKKK